jgi:hypothetical protein
VGRHNPLLIVAVSKPQTQNVRIYKKLRLGILNSSSVREPRNTDLGRLNALTLNKNSFSAPRGAQRFTVLPAPELFGRVVKKPGSLTV